jgi:hypothetical protein
MKEDEFKRPVEWATRINRRWIVHQGLGKRAEDWLKHLAETNPRRLRKSCDAARSMIGHWNENGDPKPWFYAGLFSNATGAEAKEFLSGHRLTTATVPAMSEDSDVKDWEASLCEETRDLLQRLRLGLRETRTASAGAEAPK